ncbi:hypothetical protein F5J12DRAFT_338864 [Pisolithus orientalis]|uniref:uncharacterized protein n=1 Tax=Pisolithus orientalis TaxID=936130 RepID=UPI0022253A34|nr:uncharacterized protein F5J12DRAFT_338864 [Pisolithus orientalis]KAI5997218.1 hypothetical protein F5J12DRAFT_338864 [Pisolithus orientalis]
MLLVFHSPVGAGFRFQRPLFPGLVFYAGFLFTYGFPVCVFRSCIGMNGHVVGHGACTYRYVFVFGEPQSFVSTTLSVSKNLVLLQVMCDRLSRRG